MIFEVLASIFSICITYLSYLTLQLYPGRRPKNFPPGPFTLPIFGNLLQLGMEPYKSIMKMREKYGDIIAIDFGAKRAIVVNEYKLLKELFNLPVATARPEFTHFTEEKTGILRGIFATSGQTWSEQRRFAFGYIQSAFRHGDNKEELIKYEIEEIIQEIKNGCGSPITTRSIFNLGTINSVWSVIAGKKYSLSDKDFNDMIHRLESLAENPISLGFLVFFPKISEMWPRLSGYRTFRNEILPMLEFMRKVVKEHKETYQEGILRDFVDAHLQKIKTTTDPNSSFYGETGEINLEHALLHLFMGGTDAVATTTRWLVFLMAYFPEKQKNLIDVIRTFKCEHQGPILLQDRGSMPYVEAVIHEVLRFSAIAPLGMFHEAAEDFEFHGFKIPKETMIVSNSYGIMHDPKVWDGPDNFIPERFLTDDGKKVIHHPALIAFSAGRRSCPGESFARDELFLFVTSLFENFSLEFDPSVPIPSIEPVMGTLLFPVDHKIVFHKLLE